MAITTEELFNQYHRQVYRYVYSILQNREQAQDITSKTFLTAAKKIDQAQAYSSHSTWLITIARNHIGNFWQKKKIAPFSEQEIKQNGKQWSYPNGDQDLLKQSINNEVEEATTKSLKELDPAKREIITLKIWHNKTFKEIAEITGSPIKTVQTYYYRGLKTIREKLKQQGYKPVPAVILLALDQIKDSKNFKISSDTINLLKPKLMENPASPTNLANTPEIVNTANNMISGKNIVIAAISLTTIATVTAGGYLYVKNRNNQNRPETIISERLDETPTEIITPTEEPSPTEQTTTSLTPTTTETSLKSFTGKYIKAQIPVNWTMQELNGVPNVAGFEGYELKDSNNKQLVKLQFSSGVGSNYCAATKLTYHKFSDHNPKYYQQLIDAKNDPDCDLSKVVVKKHNKDSQFKHMVNRLRRDGSKIFIDSTKDTKYFDIDAILTGFISLEDSGPNIYWYFKNSSPIVKGYEYQLFINSSNIPDENTAIKVENVLKSIEPI